MCGVYVWCVMCDVYVWCVHVWCVYCGVCMCGVCMCGVCMCGVYVCGVYVWCVYCGVCVCVVCGEEGCFVMICPFNLNANWSFTGGSCQHDHLLDYVHCVDRVYLTSCILRMV